MVEQRNIVILGGSFAGIQSAQYITKHIIPLLNARHSAKYHVYVLSRSSDFYYRPASPRVAISTALMPAEKIFAPLRDIFKDLPVDDFSFVQASATGLDTATRTVAFQRDDHSEPESLSYHALIVATGSNTHHPAYSVHTTKDATLAAIASLNKQLSTAKDIIVVGGGPTGVEAAAEIGEHLNGKPGWFSSAPPRKVKVTLITADKQLLPTLRPAIGETAEKKLNALGVDVRYNSRVTNTSESGDGRTIVSLGKGDQLETDVYIAAHGVLPNSSFLPPNLLNEGGYLHSNPLTLRVDAVGPRHFAIGDISSASRNKLSDLADMLPVALTNLKRDLFAFNASTPEAAAPGRDKEFRPTQKEMLGVVIGTATGVGAMFGWRVPGWIINFVKGKDYMFSLVGEPVVNGKGCRRRSSG